MNRYSTKADVLDAINKVKYTGLILDSSDNVSPDDFENMRVFARRTVRRSQSLPDVQGPLITKADVLDAINKVKYTG
ncbi:uncharacterized protein LOC135464483, partial [Liolophura sinensis]|uniref:uncharacterized protein LOC135464483 n=1 Tax=Liolophura sinensis TaxID=3198878 RepID=UPI0031587323